jgi:tRNA wybutosine-synthesizing protein 3
VCSKSITFISSIESGFRNSGLTLGKSGKIVLAVRSTHGLEVPLTDSESGQLLIDKKYLNFVIKLANEKLNENLKRINIFENKCATHLWKDP